MTMLPCLPRASAYSCTKGCGASSANKVSRSGVQNRNRIVVAKPSTPVATALQKIPRAATTLRGRFSSYTGNVSRVGKLPCVLRFFCNVSRGVEADHSSRREEPCDGDQRPTSPRSRSTYRDNIQFQPAGAPVPLSFTTDLSVAAPLRNQVEHIHCVVNASLAVRKPYVRETPIGSQTTHNKKSTMYKRMENRNTPEYHFGGR